MNVSFSVQTDSRKMVEEAVRSDCDEVRFGPEFCEWKIPSLDALKVAYKLINDAGKDFVYVTPRASNDSLGRLREQLKFMDGKGKVDVGVNDLGLLHVLRRYSNLRPRLGRQLICVPARRPWKGIKESKEGPLNVDSVSGQTNLNYTPTIRFFQKYRVQNIDVDWIPRCFPYLDFLVKRGLSISVHLHQILVCVTRRCHTARFLGEKSPKSCSKPCDRQIFLLKHRTLKAELFLCGNAVFSRAQPSRSGVRKLYVRGVNQFVITMGPITRIDSRQRINELIKNLWP